MTNRKNAIITNALTHGYFPNSEVCLVHIVALLRIEALQEYQAPMVLSLFLTQELYTKSAAFSNNQFIFYIYIVEFICLPIWLLIISRLKNISLGEIDSPFLTFFYEFNNLCNFNET
jgi:hypothetical protein